MSQKTDLKYLELLSEKYPTIQAACTEIINLKAILNLPKGTEHFVSDIHGEDEAFCHILNNASGMIREKVDRLFEKTVNKKTRAELCTLIYYPEIKTKEAKQTVEDLREWYLITLRRLVDVCRVCASKYTRSKVRKALPKDFEYVLDELLHTDDMLANKQLYYENILLTIIDIDRADAFIVELCNVIKRLVVDRLHIVGDIFDRGPHADVILDRLMNHHAVDIQWGNHDVLWMGAASGSAVCIANVLNISIKYGNMDFLENAYGLNMRPLALFAQETYGMDASSLHKNMRKAISVIQFKLEGEIINRHPEYGMQDRLLLDKVDTEKKTVMLGGKEYAMNDAFFPTVDMADPYTLSPGEQEVVEQLVHSFVQSEKLQKHIRFLYAKGGMYLISNGNLLFHGCIPMNEDGSFREYRESEFALKGKELLDYADQMVRNAYYAPQDDPFKREYQDFIWYLWCGNCSPLFGRSKMTTFERMFIDDKSVRAEEKDPYYTLVEKKEVCEAILADFGLHGEASRIVNGHVPVRVLDGEVPVRGGGKLIMIDGGFSRAYQSQTGIAGYTMFYNSFGIHLVSHQQFVGTEDAIRYNKDILSTHVVFDTAEERILVAQTDVGKMLKENIRDLKALLDAYRKWNIKEKDTKR